MANVVRFYRGLKASYDATTHANGIYFATDVGQILMNGVEYGGDSDKKVANVELNTQANGIVITYTDTTSTTSFLRLKVWQVKWKTLLSLCWIWSLNITWNTKNN